MAEGHPALAEDLPGRFRAAMRRLGSSVAVVVTQAQDGPVGMAATSVTSLTVDPPAMLVCINRSSNLHCHLGPEAPLSVNILSRSQMDLSAAFGGGLPQEERFRLGTWETGSWPVPLLTGAQANLSCEVDSMISYGTHSIVIARVLEARVSEDVLPLIYCDGAYL
jgi:flavin reductase (DIM6/NTAB) family NADH-FMN oxidoreductase RutF